MTQAPEVAGAAVRVRTKPSLLRTGIIAAFAAGIPVFGVLLWLGIHQGTWPTVLVLLAVAVLVCVFFGWRHRAAFAEVRDGVFRKQAFVSRTSVPTASISRIVLAETYHGSSTDTVPQLLALDARGRRVMRMGGHYWSADDMRTIAEATGAPTVVESDPLTTRQFYALFDGTAYWYEGRRWLTAIAVIVALGAALLAVGWLLGVLGARAFA